MTRGIQQARRRALRLMGLVVAGGAGCATDDTGRETGTQQGSEAESPPPGGTRTVTDDAGAANGVTDTDPAGDSGTSTEPNPTAEPASTEESTTDSLDLREANVTAVEFEERDGSLRFSVTLYHDDDGEDGYANWWQVESLDGDQLGRRKLLHAHSTDPFTRSETIDVPDGTTCVVVRGHDQTHDYGGQAMLVDLENGETVAVDQGTAPRSFSAEECP